MSNPLIISLNDIDPKDRNRVGNKAWHLAHLARAGFDVPKALVITQASYTVYRKAPGKEVVIEPASDIWEQLKTEVSRTLHIGYGLAVRSSSTMEDTMGRSMAGQFFTQLRVRNWPGLYDAIEKCWRSALKPDIVQKKDTAELPRIAVILQDMVEADLSGVAFSRNPATGEEDIVVIEFCHGTAEQLVSGKTTPYRVTIEGRSFRQTYSSAPIPYIEFSPLQQVAKLARRAEHLFKFPVDIEWAAKGGRIYILQARPITRRFLEKQRADNIPGGSWTRRLAEDLWADPLTPFEDGLLISLAPRFDLRMWARFVGLTIPAHTQSIWVIQNHLYVNCDVLREAVSMIPRFLRKERIISLFPPDTHPRAFPNPRFSKIVQTLLGALVLGLTRLQANPITCSLVVRRRANKLGREARALYCEDLAHVTMASLSLHLSKCTELLGKLLETNQLSYLYATVFSWMVEHVGKTSALLNDIWLAKLSGTSDNATRRMISMLSNLGQSLRESGIAIEGKTFDDVLTELKEGGYEVALSQAMDVLREYGVRSNQRSLIEPRWRERPLNILLYAIKIARESNSRDTHDPPSKQPKQGWLLSILLRFANKYLNLRENLRFILDSILFGIRLTLLEIGNRLQLGEYIFFLYPKEVASLVGGKLTAEAARKRAIDRSVDFPATKSPPMFWVNGGAVSPLVERPPSRILRGITASPGVFCGRVKIIETLEEADYVDPGDIIVATLMGPAWTPLLSLAGAVITEKGGLLDHFAILAREAGVPAVTGAEGATEVLASIDKVTVDGSNGIVYW